MADQPDDAQRLCCLATIMAKIFQEEMSKETDLSRERIPLLRMAICSGRDIAVELPDGKKDWVGDSARRAVRASASKICRPNQIIIDVPIYYCILRDFETNSIDISTWNSADKAEDTFPIYELGEIKTEAATESDAPECYVYTLAAIGREKDAAVLAEQVSEGLEKEAQNPLADRNSLLQRWNSLLASLFDYETAIKVLRGMWDAGLQPDVVAFNILIKKSPSLSRAKYWLEEMQRQGIQPNVITFTTLINKSSEYASAITWLEEMKRQGIQPNVISYNTLINKSPDYASAIAWREEMKRQGIQPNAITYNILIKKSPDHVSAITWLEEMKRQEIQPNAISYIRLIKKSPDYASAVTWLKEMQRQGIQTDPASYNVYNVLIRKSPDYVSARNCLVEMQRQGIQPNIISYNTLISMSPDFATALGWLEQSRKAGKVPNIAMLRALSAKAEDYSSVRGCVDEMTRNGIGLNKYFYSILIDRSPDFATAKDWLENMLGSGSSPSSSNYVSLFSKDLSGVRANDLLDWLKGKSDCSEVIKTIIISFVKAGLLEESFKIALNYPDNKGAKKLIKDHPEEAIAFFAEAHRSYPDDANANSAFGLTLLILGRGLDALAYLEKARSLTTDSLRKARIERRLRYINNVLNHRES